MNFNKKLSSIPDRFQVAIFPEIGVTVTGADLRKSSAVCAAWLQGNGYKTIGIHMGNSPEFLYILVGAMRSGVKVVLFNVLDSVETDIPVFEKEAVADIIRDRKDSPAVFIEKDWEMDEPFLSLSTSGTSGEKKLIEKSFRNFYGGKRSSRVWKIAFRHIRLKLYTCMPWYHQSGIGMLLFILDGAFLTMIASERFNPEKMRRNLNSTLPHGLLTTPTMISRSISCGKLTLPPFIMCTGEPLSYDTLELLSKNGGGQLLYNCYGSTEAGGAISSMLCVFDDVKFFGRFILFLFRAAGSGRAIIHMEAVKPRCVGALTKGTEVKFSEEGEVLARTSRMASEYGNAFFNTGDIGFMQDGLLFITGRRTSVINRSGEKIDPYDIEKVISGLPGVKSVAVFGIPSQTHGEDICAAIESNGGEPVVDRSGLSGLLPNYMIPSHFFFFEEFPLTESGKANLSKLRSFALDSLSTAKDTAKE